MKVSILAACYNIEDYVEQSMTSVLAQTHTDIEVICVDDCSTDGTVAKLEELRDTRITILKNTENLGLGPTRQKGLEQATGDYVFFHDADDWMDRDYIEKMVEAVGDADLIVTSYENLGNGWSKKYRVRDESFFRESNLSKVFVPNDSRFLWTVWNKLFKRRILTENSIGFDDIRTAQDGVFTFKYLMHCNKVVKKNMETFYHHRVTRSGSITNVFSEEYLAGLPKAVDVTLRYGSLKIQRLRYIRAYRFYTDMREKAYRNVADKKARKRYLGLIRQSVSVYGFRVHRFLIHVFLAKELSLESKLRQIYICVVRHYCNIAKRIVFS